MMKFRTLPLVMAVFTIPCAMVPFAQCTVDAGCTLDKGGKCVVNPAAPPVNCTALMLSSGAWVSKP